MAAYLHTYGSSLTYSSENRKVEAFPPCHAPGFQQLPETGKEEKIRASRHHVTDGLAREVLRSAAATTPIAIGWSMLGLR